MYRILVSVAKEKQESLRNKIIAIWVLHEMSTEDLIEKSVISEKIGRKYYYAMASSEAL